MPARAEWIRRGLHLAVLWSFGVAKPLFDVIADDPTFLVARRDTAVDVLLFAVALVLIPPALLLALEVPAERLRFGRGLHLILIGALATIIAIQAVKGAFDSPAVLVIAVAVAVGGAFAALYGRQQFVRSILTVLSPAPLLFLFIFLVLSPVSELVFPADQAKASAERVSSRAPVVMVLFDELPLASLLDARGRIDASRYPNFARLARTSTWYRRATAVAGHTSTAAPAILAGNSSPGSDPPIASSYPHNLFTLLGGSYRMHVRETVTQLCPESLCGAPDRNPFGERIKSLYADLGVVEGRRVLPGALADDLPDVSNGYMDFLGQNSIFDDLLAYKRWVHGINAAPRTLHFFHLELPHAHWRFLPDGRSYPLLLSNPELEQGDLGKLVDQPDVVDHLWQRHLLQLGDADRLLGELIGRLKRIGIWNRALVVAMPDHGTSFEPGEPRREPTNGNLAGIAPIPVFVKAPGQRRGRVVKARFCSSDVLHLIAKTLGADPLPPRPECPANQVRVLGSSSYPGGTTTPARLQRDLDRLLARQQRLFGAGDGWRGVWSFADDRGLIGRRVDELARVTPPAPTATIDPSDRAAAAPGARIVRSLVIAHPSGGLQLGDRVAIAAGGRVAAVGITYELHGELGIAAMIPPSTRGPLRLFQILPGRPAALREIPLEGGS
jgi:hypothetical protein